MKRRSIKTVPTEQTRKLAVSYARVSSKDQEKGGFSIPAQQKLIREYAEQQNIRIVQDFVDVETAKNSGRTAFGEMVNFLVENPEIHAILTEKTDRLHRNMKDYSTMEELERELHFIKEGCVISKDSRHQVADGQELHRQSVRRSNKRTTAEGLRRNLASFAPIGYVNVLLSSGKRGISPDPKRAHLVRRCFELYATGNYSLKELTKWSDARWAQPGKMPRRRA